MTPQFPSARPLEKMEGWRMTPAKLMCVYGVYMTTLNWSLCVMACERCLWDSERLGSLSLPRSSVGLLISFGFSLFLFFIFTISDSIYLGYSLFLSSSFDLISPEFSLFFSILLFSLFINSISLLLFLFSLNSVLSLFPKLYFSLSLTLPVPLLYRFSPPFVFVHHQFLIFLYPLCCWCSSSSSSASSYLYLRSSSRLAYRISVCLYICS